MAEHRGCVAVEHDVVVPGQEVAVDEDGNGGKGVVLVDDVGEVGHGFVAFVGGRVEGCGDVVGDVDFCGKVAVGFCCWFEEIAEFVVEPIHVVFFGRGYDEDCLGCYLRLVYPHRGGGGWGWEGGGGDGGLRDMEWKPKKSRRGIWWMKGRGI